MDAHGDGSRATVTIEVRGLSLYTHHGVTEAERSLGQRLELEIDVVPASCEALQTDRLEDTVDYSAICDSAASAATERGYLTLERVCQAVAERIAERFECRTIKVRAAKPEPPMALPVGEVAVEFVWERDEEPRR